MKKYLADVAFLSMSFQVEDSIFEAYTQKIEGGEVYLYTKAIVIPGALCLSCHGDPARDIDPKTLSEITKRYPNDKAIGHQVGDLRGMWSIKIPKKQVVLRM